jgi:hypothetical protein
MLWRKELAGAKNTLESRDALVNSSPGKRSRLPGLVIIRESRSKKFSAHGTTFTETAFTKFNSIYFYCQMLCS